MRKANYHSLRGKFQFNNNQHPIQDFYLLQAVKADNKDGVAMHIVQKAFREAPGRLPPRLQDEVMIRRLKS